MASSDKVPAKARPSQMPKIGLGEAVLWRHVPGDEPAAAIVTKVGRDAISVIIFPTESRAGVPKDGVRHSTDPQFVTMRNEGGCWDYTAERAAVNELVASLGGRPD